MVRLILFFAIILILSGCKTTTKNSTTVVNNIDSTTNYSDSVLITQDTITVQEEVIYSKKELLNLELLRLDSIPDSCFSYKIAKTDITLRVGDSNEYVTILKKRFNINISDSSSAMKFDIELDSTIKDFQYKHGLKPDGVVGKSTYYFINWDKERYIKALKNNIERLSESNDTIPKEGIFINIPDYKIVFYKNDSILFNDKVIVGKYKTQTPELTSKIDYIVYNPCWTVPNSIASKKMLPKLKKDSMYLQNRNMFICQNGIEVDPNSIDFSQYSASNFPFKIFQRTSKSNALGKVKFMFDNPYSIYLHDTPSKRLFNKEIRAFSHGCIRLNNALNLAQIILDNDKGKTVNTQYYLKKGYPEKVYLNTPIPINITYYTCSIDSNNNVIYHKDIYGLDK